MIFVKTIIYHLLLSLRSTLKNNRADAHVFITIRECAIGPATN